MYDKFIRIRPTMAGVFVLAVVGMAIIMTNADVRTAAAQTADAKKSNPLLAEWKGPFGGVPAFDKVKVADMKAAIETGMQENRAEIGALTAKRSAPTFENTIAELERTGETLDRVLTYYYIWGSNMSTPEFRAVEREMAPKLSAFFDEMTQNEPLFKRIAAVYNSPEKAKLTPEQQRLTWVYYNRFVRAGAELDKTKKARLSAINQELAGLFTTFNQHLLAEENDVFLTLTNEKDLAGLSESQIDSAALAAKSKGVDGWVISNTRSSVDPFLTYSTRRDLREKAWKMFVNRGDNGDKNDNNSTIQKILKLRAERAKLLGFKTHAHWRLDNAMAKTPEKAMELMESVWMPAIARVKEEVADMQAIADKEKAGITIEPWDYRFYAEKVRKERYDLDQEEVKQYLQLDNIRDGMFFVAGELFGFAFEQVDNVPVFHPDVTVWEVTDKETGKHIGLWYFDPYARDGKRSGAWMNDYREQSRMDGNEITTIVSNNSNFIKGKAGEPVLISWDDATTMFHEFGHALHGLSSNVTYPSVSGTNVARDYVEFPSQLLEYWLSTPEVLQKYALHHKTGEPIPETLVKRIANASTFNEGFDTTEYLASALIDMKLHLAGDADIDPDKFERETLAALNMPDELVMRHRTPQFQHAFGSDGYSAGYYSYLWAEVITADAFGAFTEAGGPYDKKVGERLVKNVFSVGNTIDPAEAYRNFRGRDPKVEALMKKRGFPVKE